MFYILVLLLMVLGGLFLLRANTQKRNDKSKEEPLPLLTFSQQVDDTDELMEAIRLSLEQNTASEIVPQYDHGEQIKQEPEEEDLALAIRLSLQNTESPPENKLYNFLENYWNMSNTGHVEQEPGKSAFYLALYFHQMKDWKKAIEWGTEAANKGNSSAQLFLGMCYLKGEGVQTNSKKAVEWLTAAAKQGNSKAQFYLGLCCQQGDGNDKRKAVAWFTAAANQGHENAPILLGQCYMEGNGVKADVKKALEWFSAAAKHGNPQMQCFVGLCYKVGDRVGKDVKKAIEWFTLAATQGHCDSQFLLACCYSDGDGIEVDTKKALHWYTASANHGKLEAQLELANRYNEGIGVDVDKKKAVEWFTAAASFHGHPHAQRNLGIAFQKGIGVEVDKKKAVEWYRAAAKQGCSKSQVSLAGCYYYGEGVKMDKKAAAEWYTTAAKQGNSEARVYLSLLHGTGEGVKKDDKKAIEIITPLANQGNNLAQYLVATRLLKEGGAENIEKALSTYPNILNPRSNYQKHQTNKQLDYFQVLMETTQEILKLCKVTKKLGEGGEGVVFLVNLADQTFALKMISNFYHKEKDALRKSFMDEWIVFNILESKNILKPLSSFVATPTPDMINQYDPAIRDCFEKWNPDALQNQAVETLFLIFEYHPADLATKLNQLRSTNQLNWNTIFKFSNELLGAVVHLYEKKVMHNDMKMENILVSSADSLLLSDFGCAFQVPNHMATKKQLKLGNRCSKAPEILNAISHKQAKIDIRKQYSWEAGCLLFEIAFGKLPFVSEEGMAYPLGFAESDKIVVPPLKCPFTMEEGEAIEQFKGLLFLLLENEQSKRIDIQDAYLVLQHIQELWCIEKN